MASALTIVCPEMGYRTVADVSRTCRPHGFALEGEAELWDRLTLRFTEGDLVLSSLVRQNPGDRFSKLVLSMHNFFRTVDTDATANQKFVLGQIENAKLMIGVVATPEFASVDSRLDCLWRISEALNAVIFNGDAILDLHGQCILSKAGEYDVLL